ncbi:unnamed protein product [Miscanthus lutarioriparius]|uniref:Uncharacterized protein n=1 Tax=Miscanthus lutarioriparius TaxID=422564 RepID=A0A811MXP8_9POAL|nr:unnamed protein product [Miscanthus lutarioriparius]
MRATPPPLRRTTGSMSPDVFLPNLEARTLHLREHRTAADVSTVTLSSDLDVVIKHDPFELTVHRARSGDPVLSFNSHGLFDFEPMREQAASTPRARRRRRVGPACVPRRRLPTAQ